MSQIEAGAVFEVLHPFCLNVGSQIPRDRDGAPLLEESWRPGVRDVWCSGDSTECVADGMGWQIVTIVSVHKPGRYASRAFYIRRWRDPNGREFGKTLLRVKSVTFLRKRLSGYTAEYRILTPQESEAMERAA